MWVELKHQEREVMPPRSWCWFALFRGLKLLHVVQLERFVLSINAGLIHAVRQAFDPVS